MTTNSSSVIIQEIVSIDKKHTQQSAVILLDDNIMFLQTKVNSLVSNLMQSKVIDKLSVMYCYSGVHLFQFERSFRSTVI